MLMIGIREAAVDGPVMLVLEGDVIGPWVEELRVVASCWLAAGRRVTLDLRSVGFIDPAGLALVQALRAQRVRLQNCSAFVAEQLRSAWPVVAAPPSLGPASHGPGPSRSGPGAGPGPAAEPAGLETLAGAADTVYRLALGLAGAAAAEEIVQAVLGRIAREPGPVACTPVRLCRLTLEAATPWLGAADEATAPNGGDALARWLPRFDATGHRTDEARGAEWATGLSADAPETQARVRRALALLPADHRAVVLLRDVERLREADVAAILGIPADAVRVRLHHARLAVRGVLAAEGGPGAASIRGRPAARGLREPGRARAVSNRRARSTGARRQGGTRRWT
jgi:hypothetical protein